MPDLKMFAPQGMLHEGWTAQVDDYALACGWTGDGEGLLVGDVAGGLSLFSGKTGELIWTRNNIHQGGLLALAIHPKGALFATSLLYPTSNLPTVTVVPQHHPDHG